MYIIFTKKKMAIALLCALLVIALPFACMYGLSKSLALENAQDWGVSFQEKGKLPQTNQTSEELAAYDTYFHGDLKKQVLYLTFDMGYENDCTAPILEALKKHGVKATFFIVASYLEKNPDLAKQILAEGHTIGNHTVNPPDMTKKTSKEAFAKELTGFEEAYKKVLGTELKEKYYRPPAGRYSEQNLKFAKEMGYSTIFWSLAYVDWQENNQPTKEQAFDKLLSRVHPGSIVLLHSTSKTNAAIMDELLGKWKEMGYTFGTLADICGNKAAAPK